MILRRPNAVACKRALLTIAGFIALAAAGCAQSEPLEDVIAPAADGAVGSAGTTGRSVTGGGTGATRADGGSGPTGDGGSNGSAASTGRGGTMGSGGRSGSGGSNGDGGRSGSGGSSARSGSSGGGGKAGAGGIAGKTGSAAAPTFTQIYTTILAVDCGGSNCHNPGSQHGVGFSTQAAAYKSLLSVAVIPGDSAGSTFYTLVASGVMPDGKPMLSSTLIDEIAAWIDAGAPNN